MKKAVFALSLLVGALAFAGVDNVVVAFSTKGPDLYADKTQVRDGEVYALVWVRNGKAFPGLDANGNPVDPVNCKVLLRAPVAKGGRCPLVQFEIDETFYRKEDLSGGTLSVYLLDTRKFALGAAGIAMDDKGNPVVTGVGLWTWLVNGYDKATDDVACSGVGAARQLTPMAAGDSVAVPATGRQLKIRDMKLIGDNVYLYVRGSLPSMRYGIKKGSAPGRLNAEGSQRYGVGEETDMVIITPKTGDTAFFGVETKQGDLHE